MSAMLFLCPIASREFVVLQLGKSIPTCLFALIGIEVCLADPLSVAAARDHRKPPLDR
jgi:hypothetical protein